MKDSTPTNGPKFLTLMPSKKVVPIVAICIVVVGLVALSIFYNPSTDTASATKSSLAIVNQANATGLTDQVYQKIEAELTQLATSSQSTTGSNTSSSTNTINDAVQTPPLTATEVLSQNFIREYLAMKQSGQQLTASDAQSLIPSLIANSNVTSYIPQAKIFTTQDIIVSQDNSSAAFHTYGNALGIVFKKNSVPSGLNELDIVQTAVNSNNPKDLANLAIIKASYSGIVTGLLAISVPSQAASLHLALINDFSRALNSIEGMQKLFTDPVTAIAAIQNYASIASSVYNDLSAFNPLFIKRNVTFTSTEAGAMFTTTTQSQ